jgi:CRISPR-associated protein Cmr2
MTRNGALAHRAIALAKAWLHDPPSKALRLPGHEERARRLLEIVVGADEALRAVEMTKDPDVFAAVTERLPMPAAGAAGERAVTPADGISFVHPLSGVSRRLDVDRLDPRVEERVVSEIVSAAGDSAWVRFLALWRCLPERLAREHPDWALVPADTRQPDHTLFHHLDVAAAFETAGAGASLLSFSIGPVQSFIAAARTLRDLWSGSLLLSKLTFAAMEPVLDDVGPQAFVYPSPRGIPDVDRWLRQQGVPERLVPEPSLDKLLLPAIPNRFLAIVPATIGPDLARKCENAVRDVWNGICSRVREATESKLHNAAGWDARWNEQVESFWEIRTWLLPRRELDDTLRRELLGELPGKANEVRHLADAIPAADRYRFDQKHAGRWAADILLAGRIGEALREVAHFRADPNPGPVPPKCALFGELEQMGPPDLGESANFWDAAADSLVIGGIRLQQRERLSAIGLVRRFWPAAALPDLIGRKLAPGDTRIADTATVAARRWLHDAKIDPKKEEEWDGEWLFEDRPPDAERRCPDLRKRINDARGRLKKPPRYFAVLHMDGDHLGRWLRGDADFAPRIREVLHPKILAYFERLPGAAALLDHPRPLSPARHAAISEALLRFALGRVPEIVEKHSGELIYAGGDDVIALLPVETVFACAAELRASYSEDFDAGGLLVGGKATMSAGIALSHYRAPLRRALDAARQAERAAKDAGRNALGISVLRRSGEETSCVAPWACVPAFENLRKSFEQGASPAWIYRLRAELGALEALPDEGFTGELRRLIERSKTEARVPDVRQRVNDLLAIYATWNGNRTPLERRRELVTLLQSVVFAARGGRE